MWLRENLGRRYREGDEAVGELVVESGGREVL